MPARRIKSIMHGSAESTRVYHREHRSKKGRKAKVIGFAQVQIYRRKLNDLKDKESNEQITTARRDSHMSYKQRL